MSLNSHWLQNGQPSKLEERKKVRSKKEALTTTDFVYALSTLTAGHFATSGSSETYSTSFFCVKTNLNLSKNGFLITILLGASQTGQ